MGQRKLAEDSFKSYLELNPDARNTAADTSQKYNELKLEIINEGRESYARFKIYY